MSDARPAAGTGRTEVAFFPTAICGNECHAPSRLTGKTNAHGSGKLVFRTPGAFVAHDGKHVYFRNEERIDLEVLWYGPHHSLDVGSADPDPILVRTPGHAR